MKNQKTGFVFYFDSYPALVALPPEQRGWLITALCEYAARVWRDETVTAEEILELFPQMSGQAQVAYQFIAGAILRDTRRWLQQRDARIQRRQLRPGADPDPSDRAAQERRFQEDCARMRRALEAGSGT